MTVADLLALNGYPFTAFQADDKKRLATLIGTKVVDLRPNPDLVMNDPALVRRRGSRSPIAYLESLVAPDGSVRYSRTSAQTPVWVTAQALIALQRRIFPV